MTRAQDVLNHPLWEATQRVAAFLDEPTPSPSPEELDARARAGSQNPWIVRQAGTVAAHSTLLVGSGEKGALNLGLAVALEVRLMVLLGEISD